MAETVETVEAELTKLWGMLESGCKQGLHVHSTGVPMSKVATLLHAVKIMPRAEFIALCNTSGKAAVFCMLQMLYTARLAALEKLGGNTAPWRDQLAEALTTLHPYNSYGERWA